MQQIYYENELSNKIQQDIKYGVIKSVTSNIERNIKISQDLYSGGDIYSEIVANKNINSVKQKVAFDILNQIVIQAINNYQDSIKESIHEQIKQLGLKETSNPSIMVDESNKYYKIGNLKYVHIENIVDVLENGSYVTNECINNSYNCIIRTYNINNKLISVKMINTQTNTVNANVSYMSKKLKLKKEYVKKYKRHGYSGNSFDILADIVNFFSAPTRTGNYVDKEYNFYKWNNKTLQFDVINNQYSNPQIALLFDYEFKNDIVVRTDYYGEGLF